MKEKKLSGGQHQPQASDSVSKRRETLPWRSLEQQVVRMQKQIVQAGLRGDRRAIHDVQQRLMESEAARLLAVRRVAEENRGKDTAGVDGVKSLNLKERLTMAATIHPKYWSYQPPQPVRRVWVPKEGADERRPLDILSMMDRCKQALVKLALEPEWEVRFEAHSYGYRPGHSAHDALAALMVALKRQPMFVFNADIAEAFEHVDRTAILEKLHTYPALQQLISSWLTVGIVDGNRYYPGKTGIAQGGVLSPLLMNIALHGMEVVVTEDTTSGHSQQKPLLVRYADDFVILHPDLGALQQAIRRVRSWLATMGLHLNAQKTRITHTLTPYQGQIGFDFVGFHLRQQQGEQSVVKKHGQELAPGLKTATVSYTRGFAPQRASWRVKTIITPSGEASKRHLAAIDQRLQQLQAAPQAQVIAELNPLIVGWVAYYNGVVPVTSMSRYDELMEQRLMAWASRRHPGKSRDWLLARYWQQIGKDKWAFATPNGKVLRAYRQMSILKG